MIILIAQGSISKLKSGVATPIIIYKSIKRTTFQEQSVLLWHVFSSRKKIGARIHIIPKSPKQYQQNFDTYIFIIEF